MVEGEKLRQLQGTHTNIKTYIDYSTEHYNFPYVNDEMVDKHNTKMYHSKQKVFLEEPRLENSKFGDFSNNPNHCAFEKLPLGKLLVLKEYFIDMLDSNLLTSDSKNWHKLNFDRISAVLNEYPQEHFCTPTNVYIKVNYTQVNSLSVGRLYGNKKHSVQYFPREIRSFLFSPDKYTDYDIVNSHPTLLYEYVKEHFGEQKTPYLAKYVTNRQSFYEEKASLDNESVNNVKKKLLVVLNWTEGTIGSLGAFSKELFKEIQLIRNHMYDNLYATKGPIYNYIHERKVDFDSKDIESKKVTIQALYLQSKETDYVVNLIVFLQKAAKAFEEETQNRYLKSVLTDREVQTCNTNFYVQAIPFFDGLYVTSMSTVFRNEINSLIRQFNDSLAKKGSLVEFKEKTIDLEEKCFNRINYNKLKEYESVITFLQRLKKTQMYKLLVLLKIPPIKFDREFVNEDVMRADIRKYRRLVYSEIIREVIEKNLDSNDTWMNQLSDHKTTEHITLDDVVEVDDWQDT